MPDYEHMYHILFNAATDAIDMISQLRDGEARKILMAAQQETEELYISCDENRNETGSPC